VATGEKVAEMIDPAAADPEDWSRLDE